MGRALRLTIPFLVDLHCVNSIDISRASAAFLLVSCHVSAGVAFSFPSLIYLFIYYSNMGFEFLFIQ